MPVPLPLPHDTYMLNNTLPCLAGGGISGRQRGKDTSKAKKIHDVKCVKGRERERDRDEILSQTVLVVGNPHTAVGYHLTKTNHSCHACKVLRERGTRGCQD